MILSKIKTISFDVTGTILHHRNPPFETYAKCALAAKLPNSPTSKEFKTAFKTAYSLQSKIYPCFGYSEQLSSRSWWLQTVKRTLEHCDRSYSDEEFDRFFRLVYQHFGSLEGYTKLQDAVELLEFIQNLSPQNYNLGIISNSDVRTIETVIPMLGFHKYFDWFVSARDIGNEKPSFEIFDEAYKKAKFFNENLKKDEILHIGDEINSDFCGAKSYGFQALFINRNKTDFDEEVWLKSKNYDGKCKEDLQACSVDNLIELKNLLKKSLDNKKN
jgi:REG-2-like HAD superfamily hydrolase